MVMHKVGLRGVRRAALVAMTTAALGASIGAQAQPEPRSQVVSYADLDLSKHADAAKLYARLRRVASSVCGPVDIRDLSLKRQQRECEEQAVADAVEQVNSAQLTNVHEEKASMRVAQRRSMQSPRS
ncbi:MAG TPA: UrcA family protein [Steroidobacter sp.]|jgi:UrcA family protein|nr:UrcA family protein [Steroidobacteraceae bacterium]HLS81086.1 UrcA family protein [Steroidobacter sp.]